MVALRLRGISTAITPQARLPVVGEVRDDYGLTRMWFEYHSLGSSTTAAATTAPSGNHRRKRSRFRPTKATPRAAVETSTIGRDGRPKTQLTIESSDDESLDLKRLRDVGELLAAAA